MWALFVWWMLARVTVSVTPRVLQANGTIRITCTVPQHPDNRWLSIVVPGITSSTRQLDGETERITHTMTVPHIECGASEVLCEVEDNLGKHYRSVTPITVAGCE